MGDKKKVVFFQRRPLPIHKSVEFIFDDVRHRLNGQIMPVKKVFSWYSKGVIDRIRIVLEAKRSQGDVNHVTGDIQFAAILLDKRKTILTVLDCGMLSSNKGIKRALLKFFWFTLPLRKATFVTVISESTKKELLKHVKFSEQLVKVIPVAVSTSFHYQPKSFDTKKPVILLIGTTPNKNLHRVIEAVKGICCHLNIVGNLNEDVKEKLQLYNICYSNRMNITNAELVKQYEECDMLCFVSTYEGFGMPIIEANATGRPVITSNIFSMPEVAGNAACLVDPFSINDIRDGINRIIQDDGYREELIRNGLLNCQRYSPDYIAGMYLELYQNLDRVAEGDY